MNTFALSFDTLDATLNIVGGKGANLSRMTRAGFPVPPGYFVTTDAYRAFVQANHLQEHIMDLASKQADTSETRSAKIRQLFANGTITADLEEAISRAYADLIQTAGDLPLAVRSSATAEDLPGASFAGQQDTYLNVRGESALLEAVQRCWSSLWTPRALDYRARQGIDPSTVSLAVVVQVMVPAEASGIMFTANPINGAGDEIVIDAAWGLGEAIVGGLVTPDHVVADKVSGVIKEITIADKTVMTQPTDTGTEERPVEENKRRKQVLEMGQATALATLGAQIEKYYGEPQDIEWCFANGKFYIVQARPITTLPPEPVKWESPVEGAKWLKDLQAAEWATEPLSPLGATTTFATMIAARQREFPMQKLPSSALINGWLYVRGDFRVFSTVVWAIGLVLSIPSGTTLNGHRRTQRLWPHQLTVLDSLERTDVNLLSDEALQAHADRLLGTLGWWWWEITWYTAAAILGERLIGKLRVPGLADPAVLFRGNDSLLLEGERALRQAASIGEVKTYLARFGHFVESADPIHLTLRESPQLLAQQLTVARQSKIGPDERLRSTRREREDAESLMRTLRGVLGLLARQLLNIGQSFAAHVDDSVFHFQRVLALLRAVYLEAGQRLTRIGALERAEDVFYAEGSEVWSPPTNLAERVTQRRLGRERHKQLAPPSCIPPYSDPTWRSDPLWKFFASAVGETSLSRGPREHNGKRIVVGTPGSPGRARGTARVITGPDDFHRFQPGDVLVAHTTTPIWTPLFNIASAAVTEVGGPFSHAAIVAREFGIPLVNGALDAAREISDGAPVVVDGSAGIVEL